MSDREINAAGDGRKPRRAVETALSTLATLFAAAFIALQLLDRFVSPAHPAAAPYARLAQAAYAGVLACALVRWIVALSRRGSKAVLGAFGSAGFAATLFGLAALTVVAANASSALFSPAAAVLAATWAAGFLLTWSSRAPARSALGPAFLTVLFVCLAASVAASLGQPRLWSGIFVLEGAGTGADQTVEADKKSRGTDTSFERVSVGDDWRNAAVIRAGGFFYDEIDIFPGDLLRFAVSRKGEISGTVAATIVNGAAKTVIWQQDCAAIDPTKWAEVSLPLDQKGLIKLVFEHNGTGSGTVFIGNHRIESVAKSAVAEATAGAPAGGGNFILIIVDALRADRLSLYGYPQPNSKELDGLAASGAIFKECITQSSWTKPSMSTIMTSVYPSAHGVERLDDSLPGSLETLATTFQKAGYRTCAVQANVTLEAERGFAQGFQEYKVFRLRTPTGDEPGINPRAGIINEAALSWLSENSGRPFFLYLHYMETHKPYYPPQEYMGEGNEPTDYYDGAIRYFSAEFAKFFSELSARGLLSNTTIIFTSDHGEQFNEHGAVEHGNSLYVEEVKVPLVVWSPVVKTPGWINARVRSIDIPATLFELAGLKGPSYAEGQSLAEMLRTGQGETRDVMNELCPINPPVGRLVGVTSGRWRFIEDIVFNAPQLYDSQADPGDKDDIGGSQPELVSDLHKRVLAFRETQVSLNRKLVPTKKKVPLSPEEIRRLEALGYLNKGAPEGK